MSENQFCGSKGEMCEGNMLSFWPLVMTHPSPQNSTGILTQLVSSTASSLYLVEQLVSNSVRHSVSPVPEQFFSSGLEIVVDIRLQTL